MDAKIKVTEYPAFSGYIFVRKPEDIRVLLKLPVFNSIAIDMVSDGKTWEAVEYYKDLAMEGTSEVTQRFKEPFSKVPARPAVFFDSLPFRSIFYGNGDWRRLTSDIRELPKTRKKKHDIVEEPDYDLEGTPAVERTDCAVWQGGAIEPREPAAVPAGHRNRDWVVTRAFYSGGIKSSATSRFRTRHQFGGRWTRPEA